MVFASHHVIRELLDAAEKNDVRLLRELCKKFCERYPKDEELQKVICGEKSPFEEFLVSRSDADLKKLKDEFHRMWNVRQLESAGGEKLWYKDRRT